jgi:hypothetical protein
MLNLMAEAEAEQWTSHRVTSLSITHSFHLSAFQYNFALFHLKAVSSLNSNFKPASGFVSNQRAVLRMPYTFPSNLRI